MRVRKRKREMLQPLVLVVDHLQKDVRPRERACERDREGERERVRE